MTFSWDYDPNDPPSVQVRGLSEIHRPDYPFDRHKLELSSGKTFEELCLQIDGPVLSQKVFGWLALYLRCEARYLKEIHYQYRKFVLRVSDKDADQLSADVEKEEAKIRRSDAFGRTKKSAIRQAPECAWDNAWMVSEN